ncbi:ribonuclease P protein component [Boseongicola sp. H5]|uniref:ribonuclease P protein component n=1 Tax=Boseongicola sp. H5 TaxID=2763261 RepID=UPI001D0A3ECC|nr:ribonuclease P protein component [Boseongicola sp. H5]
MTPNAPPPTAPSTGAFLLERLRKRSDFLRAAKAARAPAPGFLLQGRQRHADEETTPGTIRVGFTCSKKVGNAVARNRAKRRLREIARLILPLEGRPGWDYVLVGRPAVTAALPFDQLKTDLSRALKKVHR